MAIVEGSAEGFFSNGRTFAYFQSSEKIPEEVEAFRMGVSMGLMGINHLEWVRLKQGSDRASEWMHFMVAAFSSGVMMGHVVGIGFLDKTGRSLARSFTMTLEGSPVSLSSFCVSYIKTFSW